MYYYQHMFRRLLRHPKGELYRTLKTVVTLINYRSEDVLYMGLQLHLQLCKRPCLVQHNTEDVKSPCVRLFLYLFVEKCYCYFL